MKFPGLALLFMCCYVTVKAQQASTVTARTTVSVIYPVGISFDNVASVNKQARRAVQFAQYKFPSHPLVHLNVKAGEAVYDITVKEEEMIKDDRSLYRVTVHFN